MIVVKQNWLPYPYLTDFPKPSSFTNASPAYANATGVNRKQNRRSARPYTHRMRSQRSGVEDLFTKRVKVDGVMQTVPSKRAGRGLRWRARFVDDTGHEATRAFGRKVDAQAWLDEQTAARITGTYVDPRSGKVTFASYYETWSDDQIWVQNTRLAMDLAANSVTFGDVAFADLKPSHIQAWVKTMQDKPLEPTTIRTRFANVHSVLRAAVRDKMLAHDPAEAVKLPRQRKAAAAMVIPSPADVGALLDSSEPDFAALVAVCAFAGLRLGEAAALRVSDVDFLREEIHVRRQVQRASGGQVEIRGPKYGSERTVYAPDELIKIIAEHVRLYRPGDDPDRWLFPGKDDQPHHQNSVGKLFRKARDAASVDCRLHDLRHFYASGLIAAGCDVVTVQRALGHQSASVTLNTYGHLWPDANDRTRQAARDLYRQVTAYPLRTQAT
jgi:integrase